MAKETISLPVFKFMAIRSPEKLAVSDRNKVFFSRQPRAGKAGLNQGFSGEDAAFLQEILSAGVSPSQWPRVKMLARQYARAHAQDLADSATLDKAEGIWRFCQLQVKNFARDSFLYGVARIIDPATPAPISARAALIARILLLIRYIARMVVWLANRRDPRPQLSFNTGVPPAQAAVWIQAIQAYARDFDMRSDDNVSLRGRCWDILYALTIDSGFDPALREKAILHLKVLNICDSVDTITSARELQNKIEIGRAHV